jgi:hypothetical protein
MTVDLTGGMDPSVDEITAESPSSPVFREGAAAFIWDDAGRFGFPRIMVEGVGATWQASRRVLLYFQQPGGRVLTATAAGPPHSVFDGHGRPRVFGAGPLRFECLEPFVRWRILFDGSVADTDVADLLAGRDPGEGVRRLRVEVDARMAAPPWVQGSRDPEGHFNPGEHRFEQLFTAAGIVSVDGATTSFTGGGLRIHRWGGNRGSGVDWYGHVWQTARFGSGRAFGFMHYRPRPDGSPKYREGWLMDNGQIEPARVVDTPWMTGTRPEGEDVSFTLRTPGGDVRIEAETFVSWFRPERPAGEGATFPTLQSGITRCRWGAEKAYGMIERSLIRLRGPSFAARAVLGDHARRRCGKEGCRCAQGELHGPYAYLSVAGRMVYVPAVLGEAVRARLQESARLREVLEEISAVNLELLARRELD